MDKRPRTGRPRSTTISLAAFRARVGESSRFASIPVDRTGEVSRDGGDIIPPIFASRITRGDINKRDIIDDSWTGDDTRGRDRTGEMNERNQRADRTWALVTTAPDRRFCVLLFSCSIDEKLNSAGRSCAAASAITKSSPRSIPGVQQVSGTGRTCVHLSVWEAASMRYREKRWT